MIADSHFALGAFRGGKTRAADTSTDWRQYVRERKAQELTTAYRGKDLGLARGGRIADTRKVHIPAAKGKRAATRNEDGIRLTAGAQGATASLNLTEIFSVSGVDNDEGESDEEEDDEEYFDREQVQSERIAGGGMAHHIKGGTSRDVGGLARPQSRVRFADPEPQSGSQRSSSSRATVHVSACAERVTDDDIMVPQGEAGQRVRAAGASLPNSEGFVDPGMTQVVKEWKQRGTSAPDFWSAVEPRKRGKKQPPTNGGGEQFPPPSPIALDSKYDPNDNLDWMDGTFWNARKGPGPRACDAQDYFDNKSLMALAFEVDWSTTTGASALESGMKERAFGSRRLLENEVLQIRSILNEWYPLLLRIFTFYCIYGADITNNVTGISHAGLLQLIDDAALGLDTPGNRKARHAKRLGEQGWELLWIAVNESTKSRSQRSYNSNTLLTRGEFCELIVRAVIGNDPQPGDTSRGLQELCEDLLSFLSVRPHAPSILHDADAFRRTYCYRREVCAVLDHHEETLKNIFNVYAHHGAGQADLNGKSDMLSCEEWYALVRDLGFVKELGYKAGYLTFARSRMLVIDETTRKSQIGQLTQLTYEGFAEAIVRLAVIKALPTDKEMKKSGFQYPGEYLGALLAQGVPFYDAWLDTARRKQQKGRSDPIWRRLDTFILLVVSIMQYGVEKTPGGAKLLLRGSPDEIVSSEEVRRYFKSPTPTIFEGSSDGDPSADSKHIGPGAQAEAK